MEKKTGLLRILEFFHRKQPGIPGDPSNNAALCRSLMTAASAQQASIWRLDSGGFLHLVSSTDIPEDQVRDIVLRLGEGIIGAVALSRQAIAVADAWEHPLHDTRIDERLECLTHSMVSAPILYGDTLYGVLNILNHSSGKAFPAEWKDWLSAIGVMYGAALAGPSALTDGGKQGLLREKMPVLAAEAGTTIVGISTSVREALQLCLKAARANLPVLISGETGTGKELAARRIHEASDRNKGAFLAVNCAALTETLLESELFGHVKGAFTGAIRDRRGKFVAASGGTLFLDEISEMSTASQAKILRALQENHITPVGSEKPVQCDTRVIAATNQSLKKRVDERKFREDLYYRLCGIEVTMPPLRERGEDISLLALHFLNKARAGGGQGNEGARPLRLSSESSQMLLSFTWPGNVRQLEQAILAAAAICEGDEIQPSDFPTWLQTAVKAASKERAPHGTRDDERTDLDQDEAVSGEERPRYLRTLESTKYSGTGRWNLSAAARELGIPRKTLTYRLKKLRLTG